MPKNTVFMLNLEIKTLLNPKPAQKPHEIKLLQKFDAAKISYLKVVDTAVVANAKKRKSASEIENT